MLDVFQPLNKEEWVSHEFNRTKGFLQNARGESYALEAADLDASRSRRWCSDEESGRYQIGSRRVYICFAPISRPVEF
jgi:hypothetical protein